MADDQLVVDLVTDDGVVVVVAVAGEVDLVSAPALHGRVREVIAPGRHLVLDLSGTSYLDSAGIRALFLLERELGERDFLLRIVAGPDAPVRRLLEIAGLPVPVLASRADAVAHCAAGGG